MGLGRAMAGELPKEHLDHIISTGIYSCAVAVLNRQFRTVLAARRLLSLFLSFVQPYECFLFLNVR